MTAINHPRPSLRRRVLDSFPSQSYALGTLLRLVDIVETEDVPTAAVGGRVQPLMQINPKFVERYAASSERLLMLVMHELHHVLLGHTRLMPRITNVDNLVFDAVINAMLCRMFPESEHTSLFTDFYSDRKFPECLLRPPAGFSPENPFWATPPALEGRGRVELADVYRSLYSEKGATYEELYEIFRTHIPEIAAENVVLIGDHDETNDPYKSLPFKAVRSIVKHWPDPPEPFRGRSLADLTLPAVCPLSKRHVLRNLLRLVGGVQDSGSGGRDWRQEPTPVQVALPTRDRRGVVLRSLGSPCLLYGGQVPSPRLIRCGEKVHVYLDVSGSIGDLKGALYGAVLDCRQFVHPKIHLFSTEVADISLPQLRRGRCISTGGTDIDCVAEHIRTHNVRRAVLITDGAVGDPSVCEAKKTLRGVKLGVALTPEHSTRRFLEDYAGHWAQLRV